MRGDIVYVCERKTTREREIEIEKEKKEEREREKSQRGRGLLQDGGLKSL